MSDEDWTKAGFHKYAPDLVIDLKELRKRRFSSSQIIEEAVDKEKNKNGQ